MKIWKEGFCSDLKAHASEIKMILKKKIPGRSEIFAVFPLSFAVFSGF